MWRVAGKQGTPAPQRPIFYTQPVEQTDVFTRGEILGLRPGQRMMTGGEITVQRQREMASWERELLREDGHRDPGKCPYWLIPFWEPSAEVVEAFGLAVVEAGLRRAHVNREQRLTNA